VNGPLWTGAALAAAVGGRAVGKLPKAVTGVSIDSRTIQKGEAFFAIAGDNHDGHAFVGDALGRGAALAVVAEDRLDGLGEVGPLVTVSDVLRALNALGAAARDRADARIVALTGSVGKTGTKEMLRLMLESAGRTHAAPASFNNHWGVPLTLARLPSDTPYAVFEIGMNHPGEITPLVALVRPEIAIITTVEPVHLEFFPSVEAIADAKAEIMTGVVPGGTVILNRDNPHFPRLADHAAAAGIAIKTFGAHPAADARLLTQAALPEQSVVTAAIDGVDVAYTLGAPGRHLVMNSLAALLAVKLLGVNPRSAAATLASFAAPAGRGRRHSLAVSGGSATLLDESYNANPASMRAALEVLAQSRVRGDGRRIAVLGDMLELGADAEALHRSLAAAVREKGIDLVFAAGPLMKALYDELEEARRGAWAATAAELEQKVIAAPRRGDVIMVKGSLGSRMGPIVAALVRRYAPAGAPTA
jgi:UDP-N-acetylmuramoyl-tripeptide--D-alanyl-D-alanine ligase